MKHFPLILGITASVAGLSRLSAAEPVKPNIVFIYADDWGWGDLSCHGSTWVKTPNLDRLFSEGTEFPQFNVMNPVCSASRAALMTGCYPARFGIHQHFASPELNRKMNQVDWLDPKAPTLARFLQQAGYRTGHFGKWHLTNGQTFGAPLPEAYGYDENSVFNGGAGWPVEGLHDTAKDTINFIKESKGQPFFANVWIHESHTPHMPTAESMKKFEHLDEQHQVYAAVIADGDNQVGQLLDALKEMGLEENTIVLFSSDNGPESTATDRNAEKYANGYGIYYSVGETGGLRGQKRSLFEGGVRVPFAVRWPGHTQAGLKNETTVLSTVDMLPTLCAAAGVELPADYQGDGENLLSAFNGELVKRTRPLFWEWKGYAGKPDMWPGLAVRDGEWKLMTTYDGKRVELHRIPSDRAESENLADQYPEVVARLQKLAFEWNDTLPKEPDPACISTETSAKPAAAPAKKAASPAASGKSSMEQARAAAFLRWDTNGNGVLELDEYQAGLAGQSNLENRFASFDKNKDGQLTRDEFVVP
jgi:N-acetylgalactosamine-6-sulfatase